MYAPICELRRNSTMLPLRSRTSWRLRALTVTCLPRDWTWAGVYHFANNRRRGHDLPEGHHGELAEQAWATRHTRQSSGLAAPGPRQGRAIIKSSFASLAAWQPRLWSGGKLTMLHIYASPRLGRCPILPLVAPNCWWRGLRCR